MRKLKEKSIYGLIIASVFITLSILALIIGYVFVNGAGKINTDFLLGSPEPKSIYATFEQNKSYDFSYDITSKNSKSTVTVTEVRKYDELKDVNEKIIKLKPGDTITKVDSFTIESMDANEINVLMDELKHPTQDLKTKLTVPGNGIFPLIVTTLYIILFAILFAIPFGLFAAIYLVEYKVNPRLNKTIHFAIDSLAGIPSIIFGLFGFMFFSLVLGLGISLISGILTVIIMLLPVVIKTIEEALLSVPNTLRESSYGVGATKAQTIFKVVLPSALPGIIVAVILAISRVIGESAIFIFAAGTTAQLPKMFEQGATLTVYAYAVTNEYNDIATACAIGIVIIVMVLILNILAKVVSRRINGGN